MCDVTHDALLRALDGHDEVGPVRRALVRAGAEAVRPALGLEQRQQRPRAFVPDQMAQVTVSLGRVAHRRGGGAE